ncbi:hypothetical protein B0H10DRAFT_2137141 [Mycena sp. CBHHK59/15]|nr:hypothetical protein B0H10DRAFT_2137141 [Mycena sp. CBHHK59/15]
MIDFIDSYETSDEEDTNDDNPAAVNASATTADADARANASAKPLKFKFNMREGVAGFVEWCLQSHDDSGTMAFHWKTWGGGVDKKGFLQSYLILHAFTCHLACLEEIPGRYERLKSHPESVHELQFGRTGEYMNSNPNSPANHFSIDNYDDTLEIIQTANGKKKKLVRCATKFLPTVQKWDDAHWRSRKHAQTASRSGSEAGDDMILSDNDAVMVLSD